MYDAHTHLNDSKLFGNWEKHLLDFVKNGWKRLVNIWVDEERILRALEIQKKYPQYCLASIWFHPCEINKKIDWFDLWLDEIKMFLIDTYKENSALISAIWECWLDYHYDVDDEKISFQKKLFGMQMDVANYLNLPVVIHSRDAFDDSIEILKNFKHLKLFFHCWGYNKKEVTILQDMFPNFWIWFDWNITYKNAENIRQSLLNIDIDRVLFETDAPYLSPQIVRWQTNEPSNIKYIYDYTSNLLNIEISELQKVIESNFSSFFYPEKST